MIDRRRLGLCLPLLLAPAAGGAAPAPAWGHAIGPEQFADYMAAFNRSDFDGFARYYDEACLFQGRGRHLEGREAIVAFYRMVKARVRETITVRQAYFGADGLAAELQTELVALRDWPEFFGGPMKAGEVRRSLNFAFYEVRDGRFTHIRSANFAQLGAGTA